MTLECTRWYDTIRGDRRGWMHPSSLRRFIMWQYPERINLAKFAATIDEDFRVVEGWVNGKIPIPKIIALYVAKHHTRGTYEPPVWMEDAVDIKSTAQRNKEECPANAGGYNPFAVAGRASSTKPNIEETALYSALAVPMFPSDDPETLWEHSEAD